MDSLAILERGYLFPTPATINGVNSECPYCIARHIETYKVGDTAVMLHGPDAGRLLRYSPPSHNDDAAYAYEDEPRIQLRLTRRLCLTLPLDVLTIPLWLPPLSLRNSFIIDELANWFCSESSAGEGFHWDDNRVIEVARTIWERRLDVHGSEVSRVMIAHGMPELYQSKFETFFDFAIRTLVVTKKRPALKKTRLEETAEATLYTIWKNR